MSKETQEILKQAIMEGFGNKIDFRKKHVLNYKKACNSRDYRFEFKFRDILNK